MINPYYQLFMQALPPRSLLLHALCESPRRPYVPRLVQPRTGGLQPQGEAKPTPARTRGGHRQHVPEGRGGHRCREKCQWEIFLTFILLSLKLHYH